MGKLRPYALLPLFLLAALLGGLIGGAATFWAVANLRIGFAIPSAVARAMAEKWIAADNP